MANGFEANQERLNQLSRLGRELTRRSRAKCELCGQAGVSLSLYEVPPAPKQPNLEHLLHLCENCRRQLEKPKTMNASHWRILSETVWSETPAAQVVAVRVLNYLAKSEPWAQEVLENAYLEDEVTAWVQKDSIT